MRRFTMLAILLATTGCPDTGHAERFVLVDGDRAYLIDGATAERIKIVRPDGVVIVTPTDPKSLSGKVQSWVPDGTNQNTVQVLIETSKRGFRGEIEELGHSNIFGGDNKTGKVFSRSWDMILKETKETAIWKSFRDNLLNDPDVGLRRAGQDKKLDSEAQVVAYLLEIEKGLTAYLANSGFLDKIDWKRVVSILRKLGPLIFGDSIITNIIFDILEEITGEAQAGKTSLRIRPKRKYPSQGKSITIAG